MVERCDREYSFVRPPHKGWGSSEKTGVSNETPNASKSEDLSLVHSQRTASVGKFLVPTRLNEGIKKLGFV